MYGGGWVCIHRSAWPKDQPAHTSRREKGLCMHGGRRGRARPKDWWGRHARRLAGSYLAGGGRADLSVGLLRELGDVVGRARLEVLGVDGGGGVAEHLLVDGQINSVANADLARLGLGSQGGNVRLDGRRLVLGNGALVDLVRNLGAGLRL